MRDPMSWSVRLYAAFGVTVRLHLLFVVVAVGLVFRHLIVKENTYRVGEQVFKEVPVHPADAFGLFVLLLFLIVLVHEYAHCVACRLVGGEAREILLWPLGGLAFVEPPPAPRPYILTAAAGPASNALMCVVLGVVMAGAGFVPSFALVANPYVSEVRNVRDGRSYTSEYGANLYKPGESERKEMTPPLLEKYGKPAEFREAVAAAGLEWATAPGWVVWAQRAFWLNWLLFLLNLFPAFPLDGGRILQGIVWARSGHRAGVAAAVYAGFVTSLLVLIVAFAVNESMLVFLAAYMFLMSLVQMNQTEADDGGLGYDFSQGYTSLERDDPPPEPRSPGFLARWRQGRQARRAERASEERLRDDRRMDELLDKIARKEPISDEEKRFMRRVSERYRNK